MTDDPTGADLPADDDATGEGAADAARDDGRRVFRLAYVPGATPGKWARTWRDRLPDVYLDLVQVPADDVAAELAERRADAAILRLPVDPDVLHAIPLYDELPVVVVSRDHLLAAAGEDETVAPADLADDVVWLPLDDVLFAGGGPVPGRAPEGYDDGAGGVTQPERPATTADAIALVATGVGVTVVPMSLARLHHRKDVTFRVLDGGPTAPVGLGWLVDGLDDETSELVEELVGIVRGRTANSSRGRAGRARAEEAAAAAAAVPKKVREPRAGQPGGRPQARGAGRGRPPSGRSGGKPGMRSGGKPPRGRR
ncbi:LysR family transcriptional regulator [Isoptericola sp. NEAU-Y5]|uniref:LysR family transcriptional regulator n=1 Tax=Isoptericola luteus TaxID=2879484 RepID=A0ABS7ZCQ1_9MICO|nr:LysR substrate-binding domain-containing protein [Isoptericola sp. NEAU-Y5]MCA5892833.1 LysR family transcriptional regulator [Isoptericola sp. NEAU-Y5]